jgi:hypothetical protein
MSLGVFGDSSAATMNALLSTLVACSVSSVNASEIRLANSHCAYTFDVGSGSLSKMELAESHAEYLVGHYPDEIMARVFAGQRGITIVYFAKLAAWGEIAIDPRALGFHGATLKHDVGTLNKHEAGYWIVAKNSLKTMN